MGNIVLGTVSYLCHVWSQKLTGILISYIYHLDRDYILSLANTVSWHEVDALRDAIWKHVASETSIRVHIPVRHVTAVTDCFYSIVGVVDWAHDVPSSLVIPHSA